MGFFDRFRRNQQPSDMPVEVRSYYESTQRDRSGRAWLLAVATLLLTFVLAAALFFGGRWLYRTIVGTNNTPETTQEETTSESDGATQSPSDTPDQLPATEPGDDQPVTTPATEGTTSGASSTTDDAPSELIDTGPGNE